MARLIELLFFAILIYVILSQFIAPFRRGFNAREQERSAESNRRRAEQEGMRRAPKPEAEVQQRIDRSQIEDAEFRDLN